AGGKNKTRKPTTSQPASQASSLVCKCGCSLGVYRRWRASNPRRHSSVCHSVRGWQDIMPCPPGPPLTPATHTGHFLLWNCARLHRLTTRPR
ncbi:hypothetical protein COCMIDRAFT_104440, partial [Bipolaris oryzae ATCC 44560]